MALALAGQFKSDSAASNPASRVRGRIGVAPLPGSEVVLDWPSNTLQPCDATRCPYATRHTILPSAAAAGPSPSATSPSSSVRNSSSTSSTSSSGSSGNSGAAPGNEADSSSTAGGMAVDTMTSTWVNRAPYAGTGGTSFFLNQHKAPAEKLATYGLVMRLVNDLSWDFVTAPGSEFGPTRSEHLDAANADRWLRHGYDPGDLDRFLVATRCVCVCVRVSVCVCVCVCVCV